MTEREVLENFILGMQELGYEVTVIALADKDQVRKCSFSIQRELQFTQPDLFAERLQDPVNYFTVLDVEVLSL